MQKKRFKHTNERQSAGKDMYTHLHTHTHTHTHTYTHISLSVLCFGTHMFYDVHDDIILAQYRYVCVFID